MIEILWPEKRTVDAYTVDLWYSDAVDNGDIEPCAYGGMWLSTFEKALALHRAGLITLKR